MTYKVVLAGLALVGTLTFGSTADAQYSTNSGPCTRVATNCHSNYGQLGYDNSYDCFMDLSADVPGGCAPPSPLHITHDYTTYTYNNVGLCYGSCTLGEN